MSNILFTPSAVAGLLAEIDELSDLPVAVEETDTSVNITVGNSTYTLSDSQAEEVAVTEDVIDEVSDINDEGYNDLDDVSDIVAPVEGGVIGQLVKTLFVGGLVRLTNKLLKNDKK